MTDPELQQAIVDMRRLIRANGNMLIKLATLADENTKIVNEAIAWTHRLDQLQAALSASQRESGAILRALHDKTVDNSGDEWKSA